MIIKICAECGQEIRGCSHCNPRCPYCGGAITRVDYVKYMLTKQRREKEKNESSKL